MISMNIYVIYLYISIYYTRSLGARHEMINDDEKQPADKVTGGGGEHSLGEKLPDGFEDNSGNNRSMGRGSISCQTMQYHFIS